MIERIRAAIWRYMGEHVQGPDLLLVSAADAWTLCEDHCRLGGVPVEIYREGGPMPEIGGPSVAYLTINRVLVVAIQGSPAPTLVGYPRLGLLPRVVAVGGMMQDEGVKDGG